MTQKNTWRARRIGFMHSFHARRAARQGITTSFCRPPEPRTIGIFQRGEQLIAGNFLFSGLRVNGPNRSIWDIAQDHDDTADEIQGFGWLDDLAAVGDEHARERAQNWVYAWIDRYGHGRDAGWTPGVVGRRLIRLINHSALILRGRDKEDATRFFTSLGQQTQFVAKRWKITIPGIRRFEALAGTIHASLALEGLAQHAQPAMAALSVECQSFIDESGAIETRNPEELLEILRLLNNSVVAIVLADSAVPEPIPDAIARIVPTLRGLRHTDGGLARFHGGGHGVPGRLDEALVTSGIKSLPPTNLNMGFARMTGGRTSLIADAAPPPTGSASADGHASTLAFELTSGRRQIIVNCGSGARFGHDWRRAGRATASHATLAFDGMSSSRLGTSGRLTGGAELLSNGPSKVIHNFVDVDNGSKLELSHDGFRRSHGITHARTLHLSVDGRRLRAEDILATLGTADEAVFNKAQMNSGMRFSMRFHLHPAVEATMSADQKFVTLTLKSGEVWQFDHDGVAKLSLAPSVYFKNGQLNPIATQQVVLTGAAMSYATRVRWSLAKTHDTPDAVRDLVQADL